MKFFKSRYLAFLLVFIMVFMLFASPISAQKAYAEESAEPVTITISLIMWLCGLMGITFTSWEAAKMASENYIDYIQTTETQQVIFVDVISIARAVQAANGGGQGGGDEDPNEVKFSYNALNVTAIAAIIDSIRKYFNEKGGLITVEDPTQLIFGNVPVTPYTSDLASLYALAPYSCTDNISVLITGISSSYTYTSVPWSSGYAQGYSISYNGNPCFVNNNTYSEWAQVSSSFNVNNSSYWDYRLYRWGFTTNTDEFGRTFISPYCVGKGYMNRSDQGIPQGVTYTGKILNSSLYRGSIMVSIAGITVPTIDYHYTFNSDYTDQAIKDAMWQNIDQGTAVPVDLTNLVTAIDTGTSTQVPTQTQIIDDTGLQPETQTETEPSTPPETTTKIQLDEDDLDPPHLDGNGLLDKFPFCVPKDLYLLFSALNAEPIAPKWVIPLTFPIIDYSYDFTLDLQAVDVLRQPLRIGMTLMFLLGLIMVTRKMIKG